MVDGPPKAGTEKVAKDTELVGSGDAGAARAADQPGHHTQLGRDLIEGLTEVVEMVRCKRMKSLANS